jgi:hypothetical protein
VNSPLSDFHARRDFIRTLGAAGAGGLVASLSAVVGTNEPAQLGEGVFELGDMVLQSGTILRKAKLAYKTHGQLNAAKTNVVLYPTQFAAQHGDIELLIGPGRALDPGTSFIIVLDQLGNGLSSSPSNTAPPQDRMRFPSITILDDIAAQHRLVTERFIQIWSSALLLSAAPRKLPRTTSCFSRVFGPPSRRMPPG